MTRKIIQMFQTSDGDPAALADDGTTWWWRGPQRGLQCGWQPLFEGLPGEDTAQPTSPPDAPCWRPAGSLVWCVDRHQNRATKMLNKEMFLAWVGLGVQHWIMVQAPNDLQALAAVRDRDKPDTTIEIDQIVIDGTLYPTLADTVPF